MAAKRQQLVLDGVAGEDQDGPLWAEIALRQRLRDQSNLFGGFGVADGHPAVVAGTPLGQKRARRTFLAQCDR